MIIQLILAIKDDEQRSVVEQIYNDYYHLMYQNAYNILGNHHDTEDAVMETFIRIIDNADKFVLNSRNEIIALTVIYTRNAAKTLYNRRNKRSSVSLTVYSDEDSFEEKQLDIEDKGESLERLAINKETMQILSQALSQLPDEQRDSVMLKYYYGHRYSEIGKELGITENAARARVFRAKENLRELLGDKVYERLEF